MNLKNNSYVIYIGTEDFTEKYYRDKERWVKISAKGKKFRMTAEQVLNHILPVIADVKSGLFIKVEHNDGNEGL
ncbi:MAG: hypothetical protein PHG60_03115 [Candidatus Dojkabacteria bacterium]|jgi:hypothetical protein|nr:hypothetical protein [Candidatus Dojkabacteria bacterium]